MHFSFDFCVLFHCHTGCSLFRLVLAGFSCFLSSSYPLYPSDVANFTLLFGFLHCLWLSHCTLRTVYFFLRRSIAFSTCSKSSSHSLLYAVLRVIYYFLFWRQGHAWERLTDLQDLNRMSKVIWLFFLLSSYALCWQTELDAGKSIVSR